MNSGDNRKGTGGLGEQAPESLSGLAVGPTGAIYVPGVMSDRVFWVE